MSLNHDGSRLAVGSHDNKIYIYETTEYTLQATLAKHSSYIIAVDWSTDG